MQKSNKLGSLDAPPKTLDDHLKELITTSMRVVIQEFVEHRPHLFYRPEDIANILGIEPRTVREWCTSGHISYSKLGKFIRIESKDFEEFCKRNRIRSDQQKHWRDSRLSLHAYRFEQSH